MKRYLLVIILTVLLFGCNSSIVDDPNTLILFNVAEAGYVKVSIENTYDTLIATLVDQYLMPGNYQVDFDTNDLAEGIYFYTIKITGESGNVIESTKHMLLIK